MDVPLPSERLDARQRWALLWPFVTAFGLALVLAWFPRHQPDNIALMAAATAIILVTAATILGGLWSSTPEIATLVPVVALCVAVDLMRAASSGGSSAGYGSILLIPVIWQALRRRQRELTLTVVFVTIANVAAVLLINSPLAAIAQWRSAILFSVVAATTGQTIHRLVRDRADLLAQLTAMALRDPLTGLANRRSWDDRLPVAIAAAARAGHPLTIAMIDLDRFKAYNDAYGHPTGDRLLSAAAKAWMAGLRAGDLLVRWGGEEFALLLPDADEAEARLVLDRLQRATPDGQTFSAGFTVERFGPGAAADIEHILESADRALYVAKASGRARCESASRPEAIDLDRRSSDSQPRVSDRPAIA